MVLGAVVIGLLVLAGTAFRIWQVARIDDRAPADAIVVLGAAQYNGQPSPVFAARLEHAKRLYDDGVAERIVTLGGGQVGDTTTEAEAGGDWLAENGVPREATIAVGEGSDTLGSVQSFAALAERSRIESAVIVSDPWHSLRTRTMVRDLGIDAWTSPTHSGPIVQTRETQLRYIWRETRALLFYRFVTSPADAPSNSGLD
ncbi:MAG: YdcF family protein [Thermocrispum sp.]